MNIKNIKYDIEASKDGAPSISVLDANGKRIYLHSRYSPLNEADSLRAKFNPDRYDALIVLGAGLGYHLLPLGDAGGRYSKIIIIDIIKNIENEIAKNPETKFLAAAANISFHTGLEPGEIENLLPDEIDLASIKGISIIEHPASVRAFPDYYKDVSGIIQRLINKKAGDTATIRAFGLLYLKNILKNIKAIGPYFPVSSLFGKMSGYPCLIVTSGPSIETQMKIMEKCQDRFFIIAADSIAWPLLKNKIIPDFIISIDPQPFTREHVMDIDASGAVPVYSISSHPLVFGRSPGLVSLNSHPVCQIIERITGNSIGSVDSLTGSVSGDAINACALFGFRETALAGFDFSFSDYRIYPRGTAYQKRFGFRSARFATRESANMDYIMKSSGGAKLDGRFSRRSFIRYREAMEDFIRKKNIGSLYNVNPLGIGIRGTRDLPLEDFVISFCGRKIHKKKIMSDLLASSVTLGRIFPKTDFYKILNDKEVFSGIIEASITKTASARAWKLKALLEN